MNKIWEDDFNNLYKDFEDIQKHCEYLERENKDLQKKAELGEHYKHLYSEVKKQKDDVVEYIKETKKHREEGLTITEYKAKWRSMFDYIESDEIIDKVLRMLGEID